MTYNINLIPILEELEHTVQSGWCQHSMATDSEGNNIEPFNPTACRWCLTGALEKVVFQLLQSTKQEDFPTYRIMEEVRNELRADIKAATGIVGIITFNDADGRTKEQVVAMIRTTKDRLAATNIAVDNPS